MHEQVTSSCRLHLCVRCLPSHGAACRHQTRIDRDEAITLVLTDPNVCRAEDVVPAGRETQHRPVEYGGPGEAFVRTVANLAYGGQVVLTERAWVSVQDHIPGQAQVTRGPCWAPPRGAMHCPSLD